jgi:hypothetical protein
VKSGITVVKLCGKPDMSCQNYYKGRSERRRREADSGLAGQLVLAQRAVQPGLGCRKLFHILKPAFAEAGVRIGREKTLPKGARTDPPPPMFGDRRTARQDRPEDRL